MPCRRLFRSRWTRSLTSSPAPSPPSVRGQPLLEVSQRCHGDPESQPAEGKHSGTEPKSAAAADILHYHAMNMQRQQPSSRGSQERLAALSVSLIAAGRVQLCHSYKRTIPQSGNTTQNDTVRFKSYCPLSKEQPLGCKSQNETSGCSLKCCLLYPDVGDRSPAHSFVSHSSGYNALDTFFGRAS